MLTIHRLVIGLDFQCITLDEGARFVQRYPRNFQGVSMKAGWEEWSAYVMNPAAARGDFFGFAPGTFAFTHKIVDNFRDLFEAVGELLPIRVEGQPFWLLNVLRSIAALDTERSTWRTFLGNPVEVTKFVFRPHLVTNESMFKLAEQSGVLVTVSGQSNRSLDFYARYRDLNLKGLEFQPIWSSDG